MATLLIPFLDFRYRTDLHTKECHPERSEESVFPLQNSRSLATLGMTSKLFKGPLQAGT